MLVVVCGAPFGMNGASLFYGHSSAVSGGLASRKGEGAWAGTAGLLPVLGGVVLIVNGGRVRRVCDWGQARFFARRFAMGEQSHTATMCARMF